MKLKELPQPHTMLLRQHLHLLLTLKWLTRPSRSVQPLLSNFRSKGKDIVLEDKYVFIISVMGSKATAKQLHKRPH